MTLPAGTKLGAYEILAPLGAGGMGEVYRARDSRLRRDVALKRVPEALAQSAAALQRFEAEAQTVAAVSHPNIVAIFDVGQQDGIHYLVMELLEGETLRQRIEAGALPVRLAVDLASQVARGLVAAHAKGVVHRDLKPENLFLTRDGFVKILDFGLAKHAAESAASDQSATLPRRTLPGTLLGTVGYMSPEQARGRRSDARSDIFALGAILSEMLTGERAFAGGSEAEVLTAILRDEPQGLERFAYQASPRLVRVVERCLHKSPEQRFQDARDLVFALEAAASPSSGAGFEPAELVAADPSIAVLPFSNMSASPDTEYFSDGMTEEIINALAQLPGLRVAARTSSFAFKGKSLDLREIAERLGVSVVLEGSVRRSGDRLRITAQLIDARRGHHVWSERYDRQVTDVFAIQDEIAEAIAARLKVTLQAPGRLEPRPRDPEAYDLYLKGRHFFNHRAGAQAVERFEQAIARDPDFAPAYTGLADSYGIQAFYGAADSRVACARARAAAERARQLAPESAEVSLSLGIFEHYFGWDFEKEGRELSEALRLNPRGAAPRYWMALLHGLRGEIDAALPLAHEAARIEPLSPYVVSGAGWPLLTARRFEEARDAFRKGLEIDPGALLPLSGLCRSELGLGHAAEAVAAAERLAALTDSSFAAGALAHAYASVGRAGEARRILDDLAARSAREYVAPNFLLPALVGLQDWEAAFRAGERSCQERNALAWWAILHDPACQPLREQVGFTALAAAVGVG